jgi:hypothetical protein
VIWHTVKTRRVNDNSISDDGDNESVLASSTYNDEIMYLYLLRTIKLLDISPNLTSPLFPSNNETHSSNVIFSRAE